MRATDFHIDDRSGVPLYLQMRDQVLHAIARGSLRYGDQLPTVREVAIALAVNPNTVNRAYADLEREGVLQTQRGRGTFVAKTAKPDQRPHRIKLTELSERFIAQARALGFDNDEIARAIEAQLRKAR